MRYGWSLRGVHWMDLNELISDSHWTEVSLSDFASPAVPAEPGTYMIVAPPPLSDRELRHLRSPLYVGHSTNLRRRMRQHLTGHVHTRLAAFTRLLFVFSCAPTPVAAKAREQALITAFGPPLNQIAAIRVVLGQPVLAGRPRTTHRSNE